MSDEEPLAILDNVLWVPTSCLDSQEDEFTYVFESVVQQPQLHLPTQCSSCKLWGKKWRPGRRSCEDLGYRLNDSCKSFTHKTIPVVEEFVVKTWKQINEDWTIFARGDLGKIERLFGHLGISDQRSAPPLDFDLVCTATLYEHQQPVVDKWLEHGYGVVQAPTAFGKTVLWSWLVAELGMKTLLLAQESRHLDVAYKGLMEHTNIAQLEAEMGTKLIGKINKKYKITGEDENTGLPVWNETAQPGSYYPITVGTFQSFTSKRGSKLKNKLKNEFGLVWLEECLAGDTLVPTELGLMRLADLCRGENSLLPLRVGSRDGSALAIKRVKHEAQPTLAVTTKLGNEVVCTSTHEMLILDPITYDLRWTEAGRISPGDLLCVPQSSLTREGKLQLTCPDYVRDRQSFPSCMTPELSFLLAMLVAEGGIYSKGRVQVTNADTRLLDKYEHLFEEVLGKKPSRRVQYPKGSTLTIQGSTYLSSKDCFESTACGKHICEFLEYLGVARDKSPDKTVPWSILQADLVSQESFLAGYLEGDGFFAEEGSYAGFCSSSLVLMRQLQSILFSQGYSSSEIKEPRSNSYYIRLSSEDSEKLYFRIRPWLVTKKLALKNRRGSKLLGIPAEGITKLFKSRLSGMSYRGRVFINDSGVEVAVPGVEKDFIYDYSAPRKIITYTPRSEKVLDQVRMISQSMHERLQELWRLKYRFVPVVSVAESYNQDVFDLTVDDPSNRSFIANGLVSSNCHHESARTFHHVTKSFNPWYRGGQTATPSRKDQTHVAIFDTIGPVTARGTKESMIPVVSFHNTGVFVPDSKFRFKYANVQIVNFLSRNKKYNDVLLENVIEEIEEGRKVLVITERVNHGISLMEKIKIYGYKAVFLHGGATKKGDNKDQSWCAEQLMLGELNCIIGTKVLNENWDVPPLDSLHLPFPNFGKEIEEQRVGRVRRFLRDKQYNFLKKHGVEWDKPQPRVHVYTWTCSSDKKGGNYAAAAAGFRSNLYKKWGFDFDVSANTIETEHKKKTMKELLGE